MKIQEIVKKKHQGKFIYIQPKRGFIQLPCSGILNNDQTKLIYPEPTEQQSFK